MKGLTPEARAQVQASTEALRRYAAGGGCRRRWLLEHFGEASGPCGRCDGCGGGGPRDLRQAAEPILEAVRATESYPQVGSEGLNPIALLLVTICVREVAWIQHDTSSYTWLCSWMLIRTFQFL